MGFVRHPLERETFWRFNFYFLMTCLVHERKLFSKFLGKVHAFFNIDSFLRVESRFSLIKRLEPFKRWVLKQVLQILVETFSSPFFCVKKEHRFSFKYFLHHNTKSMIHSSLACPSKRYNSEWTLPLDRMNGPCPCAQSEQQIIIWLLMQFL